MYGNESEKEFLENGWHRLGLSIGFSLISLLIGWVAKLCMYFSKNNKNSSS